MKLCVPVFNCLYNRLSILLFMPPRAGTIPLWWPVAAAANPIRSTVIGVFSTSIIIIFFIMIDDTYIYIYHSTVHCYQPERGFLSSVCTRKCCVLGDYLYICVYGRKEWWDHGNGLEKKKEPSCHLRTPFYNYVFLWEAATDFRTIQDSLHYMLISWYFIFEFMQNQFVGSFV